MRSRVFSDSSTSSSYPFYWTRKDGAVLVADTMTPYTNMTFWSGMEDVVTPNFKKRVARGEIINNPKCKVSKLTRRNHCAVESSGYAFPGSPNGLEYQINSFFLSDYLPGGAGITMYDKDNIYIEDGLLDTYASEMDGAVNQAWSNVDVSEAAALASLGELPETIRWLVSLMTRAIRIVRFFKSKRKRLIAEAAMKPQALVDSLSDLWLEFRYAIRPLVFEAKQALEAMQAEIAKGSRQTARGWYLDSTSSTSTTNVEISNYYVMPTERKEQTYVNVRAGVLYEISNDVNGLLALWGLDQTAEAIWELTPFSFIIDWFFSIGDVISAWSVSADLHPLCSWVTLNRVHTVSLIPTGSIWSGGIWICGETGPDYVTEGSEIWENRVSVRVPSPSRSFIPSCRIKLDTAKLFDLATIGRSLLRSFRA